MNRRYMLFVSFLSVVMCAGMAFGGNPPERVRGKYVFFSVKTSEDVNVPALKETLAKKGTEATPMFSNQGCTWLKKVSDGDIKVIVAPKVVWLLTAVDNLTNSQAFLQAVLDDVTGSNAIKPATKGKFSLKIRVPLTKDGKTTLGSAMLPRRAAPAYFQAVKEETFRTKHNLAKDAEVSCVLEEGKAYWTHTDKNGATVKQEAVCYIKEESKEEPKNE